MVPGLTMTDHMSYNRWKNCLMYFHSLEVQSCRKSVSTTQTVQFTVWRERLTDTGRELGGKNVFGTSISSDDRHPETSSASCQVAL